MKKFGLIVFAAALLIGLIFANGCGFGNINTIDGIRGSGTLRSEKRNVSEFTKIDAGNAVNLVITTQKDFNLTIEADDNILELIKTEMSGDTLKIYSEGKFSTKQNININCSGSETNLPFAANIFFKRQSGL